MVNYIMNSHLSAFILYAFKIVSQTTLPVGGGVYHQTVTLPEQGRFIANLSVADKNIENRVYWSKKTLLIDVVANVTELQNSLDNLTKLYQILWGMYQNLSKEYNELKSQVDSLPTAPAGNWKNIISRMLV